MLRFLTDENFDKRIMRGLLRRQPELDIVRVQDVGLRMASDEVILEWAARHNRIVLTHDVTTMSHFAYARVENSLPMPGVIEVKRSLAIGDAIDDLFLIAECGIESDFANQVGYLPL